VSIVCPYCGKTVYFRVEKATLREEVVSALGSLNELVDISEPTPDGTLTVKPKGFLGKEKFTEIARALERFGVNYVSAGRESHWIIGTGEVR